MKKPTPEDVYQSFLEAKDEYYRGGAHAPDSVSLCVFYYKIKSAFPTYTTDEFHKMLEDMYMNLNDWNGFIVSLRPGKLRGQCTKYKRDRITIPVQGWKFITMKKVGEKNEH